ncbi:hypothetical protein LEMLEM_LOCUS12895 [Lemmus lemmus]
MVNTTDESTCAMVMLTSESLGKTATMPCRLSRLSPNYGQAGHWRADALLYLDKI